MPYLVAGIFLVGAVVSILAVVTARRGQVTHGSDGYGAPEHVRSDPALRRRANEIVEWWGTLLTALFLAPVVVMAAIVVRHQEDLLTTPWLVVVAVYGLFVATLAAYPFEKIKRR